MRVTYQQWIGTIERKHLEIAATQESHLGAAGFSNLTSPPALPLLEVMS